MLTTLKKLFSSSPKPQDKLQPESQFVLTVNQTEILNMRPEGQIERIAISDLKAVIIETNDTGPLGIDVWFLLLGSNTESGCIFPQGATGEQAVLDTLFQLPSFNHQEFIKAMSCTENKHFLCWQAET